MQDIKYQISYSQRRRTVQLAIRNGEVYVRAPATICRHWLSAWLQQKELWVQQTLARITTPPILPWLQRDRILVSGLAVPFRWQLAAKSSVNVDANGLELRLSTKIAAERHEHYARKLVQQHFTEQALLELPVLANELAARLRQTLGPVVVGNWRSRWGHCKQNGELGFNWRLMQVPLWVRRYVVIHELAHLQHMNHSPAFWQLVQQHCPQYREAKAWLKQHQAELLN